MGDQLVELVRQEIQSALEEHGFEITSTHRSNVVAHFIRQSQWSDRFRQFLALEAIVDRSDDLAIVATVGIESEQLSQVEFGCALADCDRTRLPSERKASASFLTLLSARLSDLDQSASDQKRLWEFARSDWKAEASDLRERISGIGLPFLDRYNSLDAVIADCNDPDLEGKVYAADPVCYLAIALWYGNRRGTAIDILSNAIDGQVSPRVRRSINEHPENDLVLRCRAGKVRRFLLGPSETVG